MSKKTYSEKLRDPRWQKKRLEILERDKWMCQMCGDEQSTLAVHHKRYLAGKEPWEYENHFLMTLCEECHANERETRRGHEEDLLAILKEKGFMANDIHILAEGFMQLEMPHIPEVTVTAIAFLFGNKALMSQLIDFYVAGLSSKRGDNGEANKEGA